MAPLGLSDCIERPNELGFPIGPGHFGASGSFMMKRMSFKRMIRGSCRSGTLQYQTRDRSSKEQGLFRISWDPAGGGCRAYDFKEDSHSLDREDHQDFAIRCRNYSNSRARIESVYQYRFDPSSVKCSFNSHSQYALKEDSNLHAL
ncbi:hypothetical protein HAX54_027140 [Datura stramonium]|uniref:Uncharacterized protein n=1 Tax=Datura stramonium TaxID=4076 RepID=A0ABS8V204_DATST|nr:hypothetical protein [Datura stramonium]